MKEILLNKGRVAFVDDEDYERINRAKWFSHKVVNTFYAERYVTVAPKKRIVIKMHAEIINIPKGMQCDHIDGNGLNNQKINLRVVTPRQNQQNQHVRKSSRFPGIQLQKRDGKFRARITINGKEHHIGSFESEGEAARQYMTACKIVEVFQPAGSHNSSASEPMAEKCEYPEDCRRPADCPETRIARKQEREKALDAIQEWVRGNSETIEADDGTLEDAVFLGELLAKLESLRGEP
jgi:hypothetical protein